jgi:hypothetical protein
VPISLVYRKDLVKKDGSDAFLLDAYVRPWLNIKHSYCYVVLLHGIG